MSPAVVLAYGLSAVFVGVLGMAATILFDLADWCGGLAVLLAATGCLVALLGTPIVALLR